LAYAKWWIGFCAQSRCSALQAEMARCLRIIFQQCTFPIDLHAIRFDCGDKAVSAIKHQERVS
jgi:hypothetical protein